MERAGELHRSFNSNHALTPKDLNNSTSSLWLIIYISSYKICNDHDLFFFPQTILTCTYTTPPLQVREIFRRLNWTARKSRRASSRWRLLNHKTPQHNRRRVVFINSCNFLVLSEGEHRAVCLTSSIKNRQESEDTIKSITCNCNCIKHQE